VSGIDSLLAIVIVIAGALCVFWSIKSLTMQFTVPQFVFFGMFCVLIGVFVESWIGGTKELVLSTVGLLVLMAVYVLFRGRLLARRSGKKVKT
jgi:hypothetical protein